MQLPPIRKGTLVKAAPLIALAGSLTAYAALAPGEPAAPGRIVVKDGGGSSPQPLLLETPTPTAGFNIEAAACDLGDADVRALTLVDTEDDDSVTNSDIIKGAIDTARNDLAANPNDSIAITLPAGTWEVGGASGFAVPMSNINYDTVTQAERPGTGKLIIAGAGMTDATGTTLNFTKYDQRAFEGGRVYRVKLCDMHITRSNETVTQGTVLGFLPDGTWSETGYPFGDETLTNIGTLTDGTSGMAQIMVVDLHGGFADLDEIYDNGAGAPFQCQGRYLNKFQYSGTQPVSVLDDNEPMAWTQKWMIQGTGTSLDGMWAIGLGRWDKLLDPTKPQKAHYKAGDQVAIKSKKTRDAIWFAIGRDITIENIRMTRASRIALRGGNTAGQAMDDILITNIGVERMPAKWDPVDGVWRVPMLSTAEGGPQISGAIGSTGGTPTPTPAPTPTSCPAGTGATPVQLDPVTNARIENSTFTGLGDDSIGVFNTVGNNTSLVPGLVVSSVLIEDPFNRGIAVADWTQRPCIRAQIIRAPLYLETGSLPGFLWGCNTDSVAPPAATSLTTTAVLSNRVTLAWTASNPTDWDGYEIRRRLASSPVPTTREEIPPVILGTRGGGHHDISVKPGTSYIYYIYVYDKSRNYSAPLTLAVTTP